MSDISTALPIIPTSPAIVSPQKTANEQRAARAAQDFEAVLVSEMIKPMFETVEVDENFGGGKGEEVFRGMLVQEMGKSIAKQGGLGIADNVRAELLKLQQQ